VAEDTKRIQNNEALQSLRISAKGTLWKKKKNMH